MYVYKEEEMGPREPAPQETPGEGCREQDPALGGNRREASCFVATACLGEGQLF